jgi:ubiquinone/menaquinone biosynthesis C-methylase UbiE
MMELKGWSDLLRGGFGRGVFPHQLWFLLEVPGRSLIQPPGRIADQLHLLPSSRVLEIGPGSGFFSLEVARRVPQGELRLLDIQSQFLDRVRRKIERAGLHNVSYTQGSAAALPFEDESFDVVFLAAVLGEVSEPARCLREIWRVLRPGGLLSVSEQRLDPDFLEIEELSGMVVKQGFRFVERFGPNRGYTANFRKPAEA